MDRSGERRAVITILVDRVRAVDMGQPGEVGGALDAPRFIEPEPGDRSLRT
jgi:hypothetical protein